jgi:hypothetical protein
MTLPEYLLNLFLVALVVLQVRGHKVTKARLVFPLVVPLRCRFDNVFPWSEVIS